VAVPSFRGKRVLITGGSSGIGKAVAADLLRIGADVGIVADQADTLILAETELKQISSSVWSHVCDVGHLEDIRRMAAAWRQTFDAPDIIISNAGFARYYTFEQMTTEDVQRLFDVNLTGAALVVRELLPDMIRAGGGDIVFVASIAGRVAMTPCGVYSAAKHGLVTLAELMQIELARFNVRVHVVCPGRVETNFFAHESFRRRAHRRETEHTVSIATVSRAILDSVERNRFMTYVPGYYALLVWLAGAVPLLFRPVWHRLLMSRVDAVHGLAAGEHTKHT
jgi:NAD(P)-dependent dehydrogenase (short-subunit alcohol dehydrogenase family)